MAAPLQSEEIKKKGELEEEGRGSRNHSKALGIISSQRPSRDITTAMRTASCDACALPWLTACIRPTEVTLEEV